MPIVSQAQRGWLWANKPEMAERWEEHTPKGMKLPKRLHPKKKAALEKVAGRFKELWAEMQEIKLADILTGGSGFTGVGKGNIAGQLEADNKEGPVSRSTPGGDPTLTDKTLLDRERNPRDFSPFSLGEEFTVESNPHIRY